MQLACDSVFKTVPVVRFDLFNRENSILINTSFIREVLTVFKNHFFYQFKMLTCISGVDYPKSFNRFQIVYELLSIKYNSRVRFKVLTNELILVHTVERIYAVATWWGCEIWDMFGVFFSDQYNLTRLLTDYGFQGYPLRKEMGFSESKFNGTQYKINNEKVELAQAYKSLESYSVHEISYELILINEK